MLFAVSIGSTSTDKEGYALYVPFTLSPGRSISAFETSLLHFFSGYQIQLEKLNNFYSIWIKSFDSVDSAKLFFPKLQASLLWASLKDKIGILSPRCLSNVQLYESPIQVSSQSDIYSIVSAAGWDNTDGNYDADKAAIIPKSKNLLRWEHGQHSISIGIGANNFLSRIASGLDFKSPNRVMENEKLRLAIDIYSSFFFELSENARFLTLVTVLETLTPDNEIPEVAQLALKIAKSAVKSARDKFNKETDDWKLVENLLSRIGNLKRKSIGTSLREFVSTIAQKNPSIGDPDELADKLKELYNYRSTLVHTGSADPAAIKQSLSFLQDFVPRLLELLFITVANS